LTFRERTVTGLAQPFIAPRAASRCPSPSTFHPTDRGFSTIRGVGHWFTWQSGGPASLGWWEFPFPNLGKAAYHLFFLRSLGLIQPNRLERQHQPVVIPADSPEVSHLLKSVPVVAGLPPLDCPDCCCRGDSARSDGHDEALCLSEFLLVTVESEERLNTQFNSDVLNKSAKLLEFSLSLDVSDDAIPLKQSFRPAL
jgi:hypothetical protein